MQDLLTLNFLNDAVDKYSDMIIRIAFGYVKNKQDAEDIMQDVFMSLMNKSDFNEDEHIKAWLIRVTINKSKNFIKENKKRQAVQMQKDIAYDFTETQSDTLQQLDKLSEIDRAIIYLFYIEGYDAREIGEMIGKRENTVHVRLKRAREKLRTILQQN